MAVEQTSTSSSGTTSSPDTTSPSDTQGAATGKSSPIVTCPVSPNQANKFALCAAATCWMLDKVAYCKCDVLHEKSISISFAYEADGKSRNVCDLLLAGNGNGFTVSTYATPRQGETDYDPAKEKLGPPKAFYTCPNNSDSEPAYGAQCDGAICFTSTQAKDFPGLGHVAQDEIICSCPTTDSSPVGFQIAGPWHCEPGDANKDNECCSKKFYDEMCSVTSVKTGTYLKVSAGIGDASALSTILDGKKPSFNKCDFGGLKPK